MDAPGVKKRVDESWKEQAAREKHTGGDAPPQPPPSSGPSQAAEALQAAPHRHGEPEAAIQARFDLFVSSLAMEALIALGDMPHPATRKQGLNLPQAKYLIDLLGILEDKTKGNLQAEEERLLKDALYQLRMRYLSKTGGA